MPILSQTLQLFFVSWAALHPGGKFVDFGFAGLVLGIKMQQPVTAGTKVTTPDGEVVAARQLSGMHSLLYRRNSQTGVVEAVVAGPSKWGGLNASLHSND